MPSEKEITLEIPSPWLLLTLAMLFLIAYFDLQVTLSTPIVFGDEGFHTALARWIAQHRTYPAYVPFEQTKLIKHGFSRPPLWNLLEASFYMIFGFHEIIVKLLTPLLAFLTGISTYVLIRKIYSEKVAFMSSVLAVAFPSVVTYSVLFYYTMLLLFLSNLSFLTLLVYIKKKDEKFLFLSGLFASLALLTNRQAIALYTLIGFYFLYELYKTKSLKVLKVYLPAIIVLLLLPTGFLVRNIMLYHTPICERIPYFHPFNTTSCGIRQFTAKYHYAKSHAVPVGTEQPAVSMGLTNYVDFAYGNYWFILFGLFSGLVFLYYSRDKLFLPLIFYLLLLAAIFPAVSDRAENAPRYTITWVGAIALVISIFYKKLYDFLDSYKNYLGVIIILVFIVFVYITAKTKADVMIKVKSWPASFFEACSWVRSNTPKNSIVYTIWSHNSAYCSDRVIAQASDIPDVDLSTDLNYTLKVLKENGINYLWIQKGSIDPYNRNYLDYYPSRFVSMLVNNPKYFVKVYENGPSVDKCLTGGCYGNVIFKVNETAINQL